MGPDAEPPKDRVAAGTEHLLALARARAFDLIGDDESAMTIAKAWLGGEPAGRATA